MTIKTLIWTNKNVLINLHSNIVANDNYLIYIHYKHDKGVNYGLVRMMEQSADL